MNVVRELNKVRMSLRNLTVLVLLTLVLEIGIIYFLLLAIRTPIPDSKLGSGPRLTTSVEAIGQVPVLLTGEGIRRAKNRNIKDLYRILEIRGPIGMFPVTPSLEGVRVPFFGSFSWSFGADQCASSEGFLVTFTPGGAVVIFCDYGFFSEYSRKGVHFDQLPSAKIRPVATWAGGQHANLDVKIRRWQPPLVCFEPDRLCGGSDPSCEAQFCNTKEDQVNFPIIDTLEKTLRHNLMMTSPSQGILVALKPTDEGRIGTGRNTLKEKYEFFFDREIG